MDDGTVEELVSVAHTSDRVEADMIQGLLETGGIQSTQQQVGIDGPGLGFGLLNPGRGSRRVLVRASQAGEARALLAETPTEGEAQWAEPADASSFEEDGGGRLRRYGLIGAYARIWAWSLGTMALAFGVFMLLRVI